MMAFPKLRFKNAEGAEFTSWVTSFIGDECKITTGNKDTQNKIDGGKYPFFVRSQTVERINTYSKDCEAILTSGDGVGVGKNYHYINGKFDFHQRVYCLYDFSNQLLGKYLYIYFSNYFFDRVKRLSAKNSVDSVRMDMISKMEIKLPSLVEQTKIASFLSAVDEKISQLTQKLHLLGQYKQGMMQKLFSQQIRFKADDGSQFEEWVTKTIKELNLYISDGNYGELYPTSAQFVSHGVPFIRANNIKNLKVTNNDMRFIDENLHQILNSGHLKTNDIIVTTRGDIGMVALVDSSHEGSNINAQICLLRVVDQSQLSPQFLLYFLDSSFGQKQFKELQTGTALKQLPKKSLDKIITLVPSINEQTKIANFLSSIDQKIDVVSEQLEQAKLWKKGLLQQMFV